MNNKPMREDGRCVLALQTEDGQNEVCIMRDGNAYLGIFVAGYKAGYQTKDFNTLDELVIVFKKAGYTKVIKDIIKEK